MLLKRSEVPDLMILGATEDKKKNPEHEANTSNLERNATSEYKRDEKEWREVREMEYKQLFSRSSAAAAAAVMLRWC